jgi:hypothetical protein
VAARTWVELDVTDAVPGAGEYSFVLVGTSGDGVDVHSRESPQEALRPQLVMVLEDPPMGCLPVPGASAEEPPCTYHGAGGGLTVWERPEGGAHAERLHALAADGSGGFVAAGLLGDAPFPAGQGFALARYGQEGAPRWLRQVTQGEVTVKDLAVAPGGDILVVGRYAGAPDLGTGPLPFAGGGEDRGLLLARFSSEGVARWARGFGAVDPTAPGRVALAVEPHEVATDSEGNLLLAGGFRGALALGGEVLHAGPASLGAPGGQGLRGGFAAKFSAQGAHRWSKAFPADAAGVTTEARTVATDGEDHVLLGVEGGFQDSLREGAVGQARPFIAKYDAGGQLLWTRTFEGIHGSVRAVRPLGADAVAFTAHFVLPLRFGQRTYITGSQNWDFFVGRDATAHVGTLSATGEDGWLQVVTYSVLDDGALDGLVTAADGTLTVHGHGEYLSSLGGGRFRPQDGSGQAVQAPFVARYSAQGAHLWSRVFDVNFEGGADAPRFWVEGLPGGALLAGSDFTQPVRLEGPPHASRGLSDVLFLKLAP